MKRISIILAMLLAVLLLQAEPCNHESETGCQGNCHFHTCSMPHAFTPSSNDAFYNIDFNLFGSEKSRFLSRPSFNFMPTVIKREYSNDLCRGYDPSSDSDRLYLGHSERSGESSMRVSNDPYLRAYPWQQ